MTNTNYDKLLQDWGRNALMKNGAKLKATDRVLVELSIDGDGGCNTCSYEYGVILVSSGKTSLTYTDLSLEDLFKEIMQYAVESQKKM